MASTCEPVLGSPSGERTTNVPRSDCPCVDDLGSLDTFSNTFTFDFCNIRDGVEYHLSTKPHLLFLTETQLSVTTDSSPFSVPSYFLYPYFQSKAGCCLCVRNDITCSLAHNLEFRNFYHLAKTSMSLSN